MHWLDTLILCILGFGAVLGFASGLFWQVARIAALGLAVFATIALHDAAVELLREHVLRDANASVIQALAYGAVFLVVYLVLFVTARVLRSWLRATDLSVPDRLLGALFGAGKVAALIGVGCLLLRHTSHPTAQEWLERSSMAPAFANATEKAIAIMPDDFKQPVLDSVRHVQDAMTRAATKTADQ